jgi:hypothetical protein
VFSIAEAGPLSRGVARPCISRSAKRRTVITRPSGVPIKPVLTARAAIGKRPLISPAEATFLLAGGERTPALIFLIITRATRTRIRRILTPEATAGGPAGLTPRAGARSICIPGLSGAAAPSLCSV